MSKFIIECPKCGKYVKASTSFFAKNYIECTCGNLINVKKDRMSSMQCEHCGNDVVYDQAKKETAICPICKEKLFSPDSLKALVEINCPTCACKVTVNKKALSKRCPLCDCDIDVQKEIKKTQYKQQNKVSVIKYEGDNETFIWKHPVEDYNFGTQLIVHESQEAIFFRDGEALDLFGSGKYTLHTEKLPLLNKTSKIAVNGDAFHSEVYFINLTTQLGIKWGTDSKIRMLDPYSGIHVELGANGTLSLKVIDSRKFLLKVVGTTSGATQTDLIDFSSKTINDKFKSVIINKVKTYLPKTLRENDINILEVDEHLEELSNVLQERINDSLKDYGLTCPDFHVLVVQTPDDDPNFKRLKEQNAERYLKVQNERILKMEAEARKGRKIVEAETVAEEDIIKAKGKAEAYRLQAEAEAEEMKLKGYTYEDETKRKVAVGAVENKNGSSTSSGATDVIKDAIGVGIGLGVMGKVVETVKDTITEVKQETNDEWECKNCHTKHLTTKFCPNCGSKRGE